MPRTLPPAQAGDEARIEEMRFRWRLLTSAHRDDVRNAVRARFGIERAAGMDAATDWSSNAYPGLWASMSALYAQEPRVRGSSEAGAEVVRAVRASGHWARMQRTQRDILALREVFVYVSVIDGRVQALPVRPDLFAEVEPMPDDPTRLGRIGIWLESGAENWEYWRWDIRDPSAPTFDRRLHTADGAVVPLQSSTGAEYLYRDARGPVIPGVLYHAADTGYLLDWQTGSDVAYGSVTLSVDFTSAEHAHADAAWSQRVIVDGEPVGAEVRAASNGATVRSVVADPATVLLLRSTDEARPATFGAFPQSTDPEALMRYCEMRRRMLAAAAGVRAPEATRGESDIRSGYSLAVSREAVAELQVGFRPVFGAADRELMHLAAVALGHPSDGPDSWTVRYRPLRVPASELLMRLQAVALARTLGMMTDIEAVLTVYPDLTEEDAADLVDELPPPVAPVAPTPPPNNLPQS